ncbi:MAG TPA: toll/interleukin-1 receptor domain-containing protein [Sphingobacteriaceae bacterium]|nr:toll/interleukin-1 receptor domain-containing protein [Sphingobacteriaceae bacterium]
MKAFISYSHADKAMLDKLEIHLTNLKREKLLSSWTDQELVAGTSLDKEILDNLTSSDLFVAMLSPEYIASYYCYEKEFNHAFRMFKDGEITIVPIIVEPCEWLATPFKEFKALPTDGKPVADWQNINTAFLNITQEFRKLLSRNLVRLDEKSVYSTHPVAFGRNYKAEKIFTEVDILDFKEESFESIKNYFKAAIAEFNGIENLQGRFLEEEKKVFSCLISNKGNLKDAYITVYCLGRENFGFGGDLSYSFTQQLPQNTISLDKTFSIQQDDYSLYWEHRNVMHSRGEEPLTDKQIAEKIWNEFIKQVGVS